MKIHTNLNELNFLSVLLVSPSIKLGDIEYNKNIIINEIEEKGNDTNLLIFPELCLTGYTLGDYFFNDENQRKIDTAIYDIIIKTYNYHCTIILGTCVVVNQKLINCALFISDGKLLGIVPKTNHSRWFDLPDVNSIMLNGYDVKISTDLVFQSFCKLGICFGKENISSFDEAEVIVCLETLPYVFNNHNKENINSISRVTNQAIIYVGSNTNESTTDNVYCSELFACECGKILENNYYLNKHNLNNNNKFNYLNFETKHYKTEIDIDIIRGERKHNTILDLHTIIHKSKNEIIKFDFLEKNFNTTHRLTEQNKSIYSDPFNTFNVSNDINKALEILNIQALALAKRVKEIKCKSLVIGVSAGLDSTLALLVAVKTFEILGLDKKNIFAISMPGPATSNETNEIAEKLCNAVEVSYSVISITDSVNQHFKDIGHNAKDLDIVYENTQARMRTMILFDIANQKNGIVVGTGDMSEIALGWNTFNGDHMSNYNVNAGIPKTIIKELLNPTNIPKLLPTEAQKQIKLIMQKPISPELIPANKTGKIQATEEIIGPYELHDFFLYYYIRYFMSEEKILYISKLAFEEKYTDNEIKKTLKTFMKRFKANQYKRNCSADGPSIFGISLSPRGELVLPSDVE